MDKYYVSACIELEGNCSQVEDDKADFFTLYERHAEGLSQAIIDLGTRKDAEEVMAAYQERDRLQEQLNTAKSLAGIAGDLTAVVQEGFAEVVAERDALQEQVKKLAILAEERREFIVNGAEMGYIQLPVFDADPATATYQRCLLKPKFAADAAIREIGDEAVSGLLKDYREHVSKAGLSLENDVTVREAIDALEHCAAQLRAKPAKDGV